jgi:hypothetical protein
MSHLPAGEASGMRNLRNLRNPSAGTESGDTLIGVSINTFSRVEVAERLRRLRRLRMPPKPSPRKPAEISQSLRAG